MESAWPFVLSCRDLWLVRASSGRVGLVGLVSPSRSNPEQRLYDESDGAVAEDELNGEKPGDHHGRPRGGADRCAGPWAKVKGRRDIRLGLKVSYLDGRRHLPIVALMWGHDDGKITGPLHQSTSLRRHLGEFSAPPRNR